jgi:hypothetical protein
MAAQNNYPLMKSMVMTQVADHFRPEFINRIDEVVVFHPLGREQIRAIADIQIGYLRKRLADRQMGLEITRSGAGSLGEAGFRSGLWGAATQAGDSAGIGESAGAADSGRGIRAGRYGGGLLLLHLASGGY